ERVHHRLLITDDAEKWREKEKKREKREEKVVRCLRRQPEDVVVESLSDRLFEKESGPVAEYHHRDLPRGKPQAIERLRRCCSPLLTLTPEGDDDGAEPDHYGDERHRSREDTKERADDRQPRERCGDDPERAKGEDAAHEITQL